MMTEEEYNNFVESIESKYPEMFTKPYGGFAVGSGWHTLVTNLIDTIYTHVQWRKRVRENLLKENPYNRPIPEDVNYPVVVQIKEKFGTLRFYTDGVGDEYCQGAIALAELMSGHICEVCGAPGERRSDGWIQTLCDEHHANRGK